MQTDGCIVREKSTVPPPLPPWLILRSLHLQSHCDVKINRMKAEMHFMG